MTAEFSGRNRLVVVDGHAVLHRAWHALPPLATKDGTVVSGAYGFLMTLLRAVRELKPTHVAVTFDLKGPTFRHEAYGGYKATREKRPDELYAQVPIIERALKAMDIPVYAAAGYEADDAIGTIVATAEKQDPRIDSVIVTGDLDTLQLVDDNTRVFTMRKGMSDTVIYDEAAVRARFGLAPKQMIDYKALRGDPSDNIPGVKGIGEKTASELIAKFGSVAGLYAAIDAGKDGLKPGVHDKLVAGREAAVQALDLCRIRKDVPVDFKLPDAELRPFDRGRLLPIFEEYEFTTLIKQLSVGEEGAAKNNEDTRHETRDTRPEIKDQRPGDGDSETARQRDSETLAVAIRKISDAKKLARELKKQENVVRLAFRTVTESSSPHARPVAIGLWFGDTGLIVEGAALESPALAAFFSRKDLAVVTHDLKREINATMTLDILLPAARFDLLIAYYLLHSGDRRVDLGSLLSYYRGVSAAAKETTTEEKVRRLADELPHLLPLADEAEIKLKNEKLDRVMEKIEMPTAAVLARMERAGVGIDADYLRSLSADFGKKLDRISTEAYRLAGGEFNLNSPAQVKEVLFDRLLISAAGIRKTVKGKALSTAAAELEKLRDQHPIIGSILAWRELSKLKSTYVDALPEMVDPVDRRIHASFNQAVTATGRLSSSDPNMQNIPTADTEYGRLVRDAFIPARGYRFLAADYSQIELRIAAHLAQEQLMVDSFRKGEDIHWRTAVEMFSEAEAPAKRRIAKVINFGVLYGMGANSLAEAAGISIAEARDYIDRYFSLHQGIADYVVRMKEQLHDQGFVETLFGRRRYFPNFQILGQRERAEAERQAVNMPLQGSQADMTKLAMVRIDEAFRQRWGDDEPARLIIQVHDELVFEVKPAVMKEAAAIVRDKMTSVVELAVPIEVKLMVGKKWGEMTQLNEAGRQEEGKTTV